MDKDRKKIQQMFSRIARRYDLLNHLLSFGIDTVWRRKTANLLNVGEGAIILDVCGGTGDMAAAFERKSRKIICDFCRPLLAIAKKKLKSTDSISIIEADAFHLPIKDNSVDIVAIAFGLRNLDDTEEALKEFNRVLKQNGRLAVLEFSLPINKFICLLYKFYLRFIAPVVGGIISGDLHAYTYLQESIETFPRYEDLLVRFANNNYKEMRYYPFTFGIATLYLGIKS